jgi:hypothetical protein
MSAKVRAGGVGISLNAVGVRAYTNIYASRDSSIKEYKSVLLGSTVNGKPGLLVVKGSTTSSLKRHHLPLLSQNNVSCQHDTKPTNEQTRDTKSVACGVWVYLPLITSNGNIMTVIGGGALM